MFQSDWFYFKVHKFVQNCIEICHDVGEIELLTSYSGQPNLAIIAVLAKH